MKTYNKFPLWIAGVSNLNAILLYVAGFLIINQLGIIVLLIYVAFVIILEIRLIRYHCVNCFYYGKVCGFGKGRLSALFFKKGKTSDFCSKELGWKDMIPDMLLSLIPFVTGIVLLILEFNVFILAALLVIILTTTVGNSFIRGSLTCKYCKQKELGCPAEQLFQKK
ncbi:MAG: hypothetical protein JXA77_05035 [Bacteroidales bacterium]|nr:hypothetical protein [Bacteroidales bacterium]MBN2820412.1 hypothetical protein [Bacteroidales bacterium]